MIKLLIGIAIGLILGWNLFPQPASVKRLYDRIANRFINWISTWTLIGCCFLSGCTVYVPGITPVEKPYPWKQRAVAEIALASVQTSPTPLPGPAPRVGDKCPDCNDPPGACGVGRVGDGSPTGCNKCQTCRGDGRIDDADVSGELGAAAHSVSEEPANIESDATVDPAGELTPEPAKSVVELPKEITLHMTRSTQGQWANKWYTHERKAFEDRGWIVRAVLEPDGSIDAAYFEVQGSDGRTPQFFEPLTLKMIEYLETP